jgi:hypothetical protein
MCPVRSVTYVSDRSLESDSCSENEHLVFSVLVSNYNETKAYPTFRLRDAIARYFRIAPSLATSQRQERGQGI